MITAALLAVLLGGAPGFEWEVVVIDQETKQVNTLRSVGDMAFRLGPWTCRATPRRVEVTEDSDFQDLLVACGIRAAGSDKKALAQLAAASELCLRPKAEHLVDTAFSDMLDGGLEVIVRSQTRSGPHDWIINTKCLR
jgi:hypothetical protein